MTRRDLPAEDHMREVLKQGLQQGCTVRSMKHAVTEETVHPGWARLNADVIKHVEIEMRQAHWLG